MDILELDHRDLHLPAGCTADARNELRVMPEDAGWEHAALRVIRLEAGGSQELSTGEFELAVLPLAGSCAVEVDGRTLELAGRDDVFSAVSDFAYVGRDSELRISSRSGGEFALPGARARRRIDAYRCDGADVPVEVRGAGIATRQVNNFLAPSVCEADRLTAVEVLTPAGNWSSWPPHKHDDAASGSGEAALEEIYYFRIDGERDVAFGMHRTYDMARGWDVSVAVHTGDVFLVPSGYHGPCIAAPTHDMYYLNVLAGPGEQRSLAFSDDPAYAHVRDEWIGMEVDPRVPMAGAVSGAST